MEEAAFREARNRQERFREETGESDLRLTPLNSEQPALLEPKA